MPAEHTVRPGRANVEIFGPRVVVGQTRLIAVRRVDIERPGLQGLQQIAPQQVGLALKHQPAVQAEGGHSTACRPAAIQQGLAELVLRQVPLGLGPHKPARSLPGSADLGDAQPAVTVDIGQGGRHRRGAGRGKAGVLPCQRPVQSAQCAQLLVGLAPAQIHLGHPVIRSRDGSRRILQRLPRVAASRNAHRPHLPRQHHLIGQQALGQYGRGTRKVAPVVVVAHAVEVDAQARGTQQGQWWQRMVVLNGCAPALGAAQSVAGHVGGAHLTVVFGVEIAELTTQIDAALGHQCGVKRGIQVGGDVPVVRQRDFKSAEVGQVDGGWQQAAFALV